MLAKQYGPQISVVTSVFNGEAYLEKAIESILNQTFRNYEFIIVNDGSTDSSQKIIHSYKDPRIKLVNNSKNIGLARSLNKGIKLAKGKYIARIDADDYCSADRLAVQYEFMEKHKDIDILGSWTRIHRTVHFLKYPTNDSDIKTEMLFNNPLVHSSVFARSDLLKKNAYDPAFIVAQDYDLWSRLIDKAKFANLPEILVYRIEHKGNVSNKKNTIRKQLVGEIHKRLLDKISINATPKELDLHAKIFMGNRTLTDNDVPEVGKWITKIFRSNRKTNYYTSTYLYKRTIVYLLVKMYTSKLSFLSKIKLVKAIIIFGF